MQPLYEMIILFTHSTRAFWCQKKNIYIQFGSSALTSSHCMYLDRFRRRCSVHSLTARWTDSGKFYFAIHVCNLWHAIKHSTNERTNEFRQRMHIAYMWIVPYRKIDKTYVRIMNHVRISHWIGKLSVFAGAATCIDKCIVCFLHSASAFGTRFTLLMLWAEQQTILIFNYHYIFFFFIFALISITQHDAINIKIRNKQQHRWANREWKKKSPNQWCGRPERGDVLTIEKLEN